MPVAPASGSSLGDLYSKCVQLHNENKISSKNVWELPLIDHMDDICDSFMGGKKRKQGADKEGGEGGAAGGGGGAAAGGRKSLGAAAQAESGHLEENRFHEASCTIEASARIYACRVDCVHTDTYRVLGGLNSADMGDDDDGKDGEDGKGPKKRRICGVNTLEKNEASIVQTALETDEQSDPSFRRMAAAFDAGGAKGLLLGHLPIAEDLSLVFNGDVPLSRAQGNAKVMFEAPRSFPCAKLGLGDAAAAAAKFGGARACPGVDVFRQQLWGGPSNSKVSLPDSLEALLGPNADAASSGLSLGLAALGAPGGPPPALMGGAPPPLPDMDGMMDLPDPDVGGPLDDGLALGAAGNENSQGGAARGGAGALALPLTDMEGAIVAVNGNGNEDVIAFDEMFKNFCQGPGSHQFAFFDECWAKRSKEAKDPSAASGDKGGRPGQEGALVAAEPPPKEKAPKKPLFDLAGLGKPPRPIETEPVQKHQLSERAVQWQLHKDVPPYMIDRITMPSWPTWSKCDFACLGLRPHLMLKLMKKPTPEGEGPHRFTDLFSTVVVENPDAYPWLSSNARAAAHHSPSRSDDDDTARAEREMEFGDDAPDDDGFGGNGGLPAHLDVDPQDLFLRPDDKVLPGSDHEPDDLFGGGADGFCGGADEVPFAGGAGGDLDLVDQPTTVGDVGIGYSRNSKFVDVKLVKKHLWDNINEDIEDAKAAVEDGQASKAESSFQDLVDRTLQRLPKAETPNLSVAVCFICALHLCNEKGLELQVDPEKPFGDFAVVGQL